MKVVLSTNIKGLGKALDIVDVSEGYARNYLIPRKLAKIADNKSISESSSKKEAIKFRKDTERENMLVQKEKIEQIMLSFKLKSSESGKLFGSITAKEIADELLNLYNLKIDKKKILLEPIKTLGSYTAKIKLYEGVIANLKIKVENM